MYIEEKTSLGALSKTFVGNARICNARSGKVGSSHCYRDRRPLYEIDEIVYEYDIKHSQQLVYVVLSRVILIRYFILYACVDHGTYYKFYFKILGNF